MEGMGGLKGLSLGRWDMGVRVIVWKGHGCTCDSF